MPQDRAEIEELSLLAVLLGLAVAIDKTGDELNIMANFLSIIAAVLFFAQAVTSIEEARQAEKKLNERLSSLEKDLAQLKQTCCK